MESIVINFAESTMDISDMELLDRWTNMFNYKIWHIGRPDGLPSKDACHRPPGFDPRDLLDVRQRLTPTTCPLGSIHEPWHGHTSPS